MPASGGTITGSSAPLTAPLNYPPPVSENAVTTINNASIPSTYFNSSTRDLAILNGTVLTLPGGTYYVNNISWSASTITFTDPVVFYVADRTFFTFNNSVDTYQSVPANLKFEVTGACNVTYDFDTSCYAVLYAPPTNIGKEGFADDLVHCHA